MLQTNSNISNKGKRVFVGLSGGVDSAVSAAILKEQGFDVTGVFIKVWQPDFLPCNWRTERRDAMKVAIALDIPFIFLDFGEEYLKGVIEKMIDEYKLGRTPNPDILCNKEIKFGIFWKKAFEMGVDYIATGHYAQLQRIILCKDTKDNPLYQLLEGKDKEKDQSYFLWTLTQKDIAHTIFPIGHLEKKEVRALARQYQLPVSEKKDSQGICFIGDIGMDEFLSHFVSTTPGDVLNTRGEIIGTHKGALFYTIGERHGFEILKKKPTDGPFFLVSKDMKKNTITVSNETSEVLSLSPVSVKVKNVNWIHEPNALSLTAKIRYRGQKISVDIEKLKQNIVMVKFKEPMRGLSLGQSIVFYNQEVCLGGGVMDEVV